MNRDSNLYSVVRDLYQTHLVAAPDPPQAFMRCHQALAEMIRADPVLMNDAIDYAVAVLISRQSRLERSEWSPPGGESGERQESDLAREALLLNAAEDRSRLDLMLPYHAGVPQGWATRPMVREVIKSYRSDAKIFARESQRWRRVEKHFPDDETFLRDCITPAEIAGYWTEPAAGGAE
jgi:hypothetical protein